MGYNSAGYNSAQGFNVPDNLLPLSASHLDFRMIVHNRRRQTVQQTASGSSPQLSPPGSDVQKSTVLSVPEWPGGEAPGSGGTGSGSILK